MADDFVEKYGCLFVSLSLEGTRLRYSRKRYNDEFYFKRNKNVNNEVFKGHNKFLTKRVIKRPEVSINTFCHYFKAKFVISN